MPTVLFTFYYYLVSYRLVLRLSIVNINVVTDIHGPILPQCRWTTLSLSSLLELRLLRCRLTPWTLCPCRPRLLLLYRESRIVLLLLRSCKVVRELCRPSWNRLKTFPVSLRLDLSCLLRPDLISRPCALVCPLTVLLKWECSWLPPVLYLCLSCLRTPGLVSRSAPDVLSVLVSSARIPLLVRPRVWNCKLAMNTLLRICRFFSFISIRWDTVVV